MKVQFLQHEYTWSNHCITGNALGWGITASSIPQSKTMLHELEKMASRAEPDRMGQIPVWDMSYSPATGFVRLWTVPTEQGEDGRINKLVRMLQVSDPGERDPSVYFAGLEEWNPGSQEPVTGDSLPKLAFTPYEEPVNAILKSMNLYDRLPVFLRAIFWCLLEYSDGLNFIGSGWKKEEFAFNAGRVMFAMHCLLPEYLRQKAGYRSRAWQDCDGISFYFSEEEYGTACFHLDGEYPPLEEGESDELERLFYNTLAEYWKQDQETYHNYMMKASDYLEQSAGKGDELKKIQWIFYEYALSQKDTSVHVQPLSVDYIIAKLPELIYWSFQEEELLRAARRCLACIHTQDLSGKQEQRYFQALIDGVSKRSLKRICKEAIWVLRRMKQRDCGFVQQNIAFLKGRNKTIYQIVKKNLGKEEEWDKLFKAFEDTEETMKKDKSELKGRGIENNDLLLKEQDGLREEEKELSESFGSLAGKMPEDLKEADGPGMPGHTSDTCEEVTYRELEETDEELEEDSGPFSEFFLTGLPFGFLTGCVLFLSHYSLMIGHWKIALGMGGMWILLMLNYVYLLFSRHQRRPLWKSIGLSLVEGYLIKIAASMIVDQKLRLYFFIALGAITVAVQMFNIIRTGRGEKG